MSLDTVELVISIEEAFGIFLSDDAVTSLKTPRLLIAYLSKRLASAPEGFCLSQRAFYQLRQSICKHTTIDRSELQPDSDLSALVPEQIRENVWESTRLQFGTEWWSRATKPLWIRFNEAPPFTRMRDAVMFIVARTPWRIRRRNEKWSRSQIAEVVHALMWELFGLRRSEYTEDSRWLEDLGLD